MYWTTIGKHFYSPADDISGWDWEDDKMKDRDWVIMNIVLAINHESEQSRIMMPSYMGWWYWSVRTMVLSAFSYLQCTIVRRTHFCAMVSVQSGVLSLIIGNLFFLCPRVVNQTSTGRIIDTYLLLVWGEDGRKRTVGKGHSLFHVCALVLQHSSVNLSDRLFVLEKQ